MKASPGVPRGARVESLHLPYYSGLVMPTLTPVTDASGKITDVTISDPQDLRTQMLEFAGLPR